MLPIIFQGDETHFSCCSLPRHFHLCSASFRTSRTNTNFWCTRHSCRPTRIQAGDQAHHAPLHSWTRTPPCYYHCHSCRTFRVSYPAIPFLHISYSFWCTGRHRTAILGLPSCARTGPRKLWYSRLHCLKKTISKNLGSDFELQSCAYCNYFQRRVSQLEALHFRRSFDGTVRLRTERLWKARQYKGALRHLCFGVLRFLEKQSA